MFDCPITSADSDILSKIGVSVGHVFRDQTPSSGPLLPTLHLLRLIKINIALLLLLSDNPPTGGMVRAKS